MGKLKLSFFCKRFVLGAGPEDKRTAWIPCSAGCSKEKRCIASASAWFHVLLEYITAGANRLRQHQLTALIALVFGTELLFNFLLKGFSKVSGNYE